jgi:hypothetical protein
MFYADKVTKQFHNYGNSLDQTAPSPMSDYQDPTYVGFQIQLVEIPTRSVNNLYDMNDLPHGLFSQDPEKDIYSTYNYLKNRGEYKRANYILLFEKHFKQLINECPWYFVKVSGLADAWKMDPAQNWRGKDKKLTIETLESIDLKMNYIIDLYRKAVWDANWMRWAVPDHMRYFKMNIVVSEVRPMKFGVKKSETTNSPGQPKNEPQSKFAKAKEKIVDGVNNRIDSFKASVGLSNANQREQYGLYDPTVPWSTATFVKFSFEQCEIDFFTEAPPFLESVGISPDVMATNKLIIKTNVIRERNVYGLLGAILEDTATYSDYGKDAANKTIYTPSPIPNENGVIPESVANEASAKDDFGSGLLQRDQSQKQFNSDNGLPNSSGLLGQLAGRALKGLEAAATDFVKNQVNSFLLGNAFGVSPTSLLGSAQDILNNPAGAIENLLRKHSSPTIGSEIAKKVELTGAEIELVQNIIGQGNMQGNIPIPGNLGSVSFESNANAGGPLGNANLTTVPVNPGVAGRAGTIADSGNDITTDSSNIGNASLEAPNVNRSSPQKTNLTAFAQAGTNPGKADLTAPFIPKTTLGKADL